MQVITLTYEVEGGDLALFRAAIAQHAGLTRQREPGCMRFDVNFGAERQTLCLAYLVFETLEALEHHFASDHYNLFDELSVPWVISRTEQSWELAASPRRSGLGP